MAEEEGMATAPEPGFSTGALMGMLATFVGVVVGIAIGAAIWSGQPDRDPGREALTTCGKGNVMRVDAESGSYSCWDTDRHILQP